MTIAQWHKDRARDMWLVLKGVVSFYVFVFEFIFVLAVIVKTFELLDVL
jgi:hypothetical protein